MNIFIKKLYIVPLLVIATLSHVYAAHMYIDAPHTASSNRGPLSFSIILDAEGDMVSGISGNFSYPSELFDVKVISTQNGFVPLWIVNPHVSEEKTFDQRTHIVFEGIIPGGFGGVHSPYAQGIYPGIVCTITLIPKGFGQGNFTLDDIELHAFDSKGTLLPSTSDTSSIMVPMLSGKEVKQSTELTIAKNTSVTMTVATSEFVNNNAPYVYVREENPSHTIDHIEIAETNEYNPNYVSSYDWHTVTNPYVLAYSSRTKYIHAKIVYTDNTYTTKTIPPVENSQSLSHISRILLYIIVAISLLYHYGKNFLHLIPKNRTKHH
jgi:hypothetical protein